MKCLAKIIIPIASPKTILGISVSQIEGILSIDNKCYNNYFPFYFRLQISSIIMYRNQFCQYKQNAKR